MKSCWPTFTVTILALIVLQSTACLDQSDIDLDATIIPLFAHFDVEGSPGAAVMVIRGGEVVHASGHGLADLRSRRPLQSSTPVRLASLSKAFTAMAIVLLEERRSVAYESPASEWVPELNRFETVTVRHLLNHTSGLPSYYKHKMSLLEEMAKAKDREQLFTSVDAIALYENWGELSFEPGSRFQYSNPGYEILGLIIERASGDSYGTFLEKNIFEPLGMETAVVRDGPEVMIPNRAIGYSQLPEGGGWSENDDHWANWAVGAGGVYASLYDLYRWDSALSEGTLISRESLEEVFSPAALEDGSDSLYGFGWGLQAIAGHSAIHHTGAWVGFRTAIARFPDDQLTVVVLSNATAEAAALSYTVAETVLGKDRILEIFRIAILSLFTAILSLALTLVLNAPSQFKEDMGRRSRASIMASKSRDLWSRFRSLWRLGGSLVPAPYLVGGIVISLGVAVGYLYNLEWRSEQYLYNLGWRTEQGFYNDSTDRTDLVMSVLCLVVGGLVGSMYVLYGWLFRRTILTSALGIIIIFSALLKMSNLYHEMPPLLAGYFFTAWIFGLFFSAPLLPWAAGAKPPWVNPTSYPI